MSVPVKAFEDSVDYAFDYAVSELIPGGTVIYKAMSVTVSRCWRVAMSRPWTSARRWAVETGIHRSRDSLHFADWAPHGQNQIPNMPNFAA